MEAHAEQDITLVLMDKNVYDLSDGSGKCAAVVGMKDCLNETGAIQSDGDGVGWNDCDRRRWANSDFIAALPAVFRNTLKEVKTYTAGTTGKQAPAVESDDKAMLLTEKEYFGKSNGGSSIAEANCPYLQYYQSPTNVIKKINGVATKHWTRTRQYSLGGSFVNVTATGEVSSNSNGGEYGLSMHMAI